MSELEAHPLHPCECTTYDPNQHPVVGVHCTHPGRRYAVGSGQPRWLCDEHALAMGLRPAS